jgi:hypothetical protein
VIRVAVTATNTAGQLVAYSTPTGHVITQAPKQVSPPLFGEGKVGEGAELTAEPGTWDALPSPTYTYRWERQAPDSLKWDPIPGASNATYRLVRDDVGMRVRVVITATNPVGSADAPSVPTDPVPGPPVNTLLPSVRGEPRVGQTLTADRGRWTGWPSPEVSFQWRRLGPNQTEWSDIADATTDSYEVRPDDVLARLRVAVTARNATGSETKESEPTAAIEAG